MRLLFVHAHPDDETLATGLTMASYAARGHDVHVLTCTLGEEGEVIPPELAYLAADRTDALGLWRREELRRAMGVLGVSHRVLGEDPASGVLSRFRDSGMTGMASAHRPDAFVQADLEEATDLVTGEIDRVRPDVVVTYDRHGGYGHPDHIQTHRVTLAALNALAERGGSASVPAAYVILTPRSWATADRLWLAENVDPRKDQKVEQSAGHALTVLDVADDYPPSVADDEAVTHEVVDVGSVAVQAAALEEHRTQVTVFDGYYALSNDVALRLSGREGFAPVDPRTGRLLPTGRSSSDAAAARHTGLDDDVARV